MAYMKRRHGIHRTTRRRSLEQTKNRNRLFFYGIMFLCNLFISIGIFSKHGEVKRIKISPFLTTYGTQVIQQGKPYTFTGYNMFQIASLSGHNVGCGSNVNDINSFFATLRPNSIVRFWAWQGSMAINPTTKQLDWAGIDRVLAAAKKYNQKVIVSLGTQSGECDDGQWNDSTWYQGGYKNVYNPSGFTPLSYWDY